MEEEARLLIPGRGSDSEGGESYTPTVSDSLEWSEMEEGVKKLSAAVVGRDELAILKGEARAKFEALRMDDSDVKSASSRRKVRAFYRQQNEYIDSLQRLDNVSLSSIEPHDEAGRPMGGGEEGRDQEEGGGGVGVYGGGAGMGGAGRVGERGLEESWGRGEGGEGGEEGEEGEEGDWRVRAIVRISLVANVVLLIAKLFAAIDSGSLSVIASAVDSGLDLVSGIIMFVTERAITNRDPYKYPVGRRRLEPLGIIVFSSVMGTAALQLILTGILRLLAGETEIELGLATILVLIGTIVIKLGLYLACLWVSRSVESQIVETLGTDHITDVCTNAVGTVAAVVAALWMGWVDSACGVGLAVWIIYVWGSTAKEQMMKLTGKSAPVAFLRKITYMAAQHHPDALVDTVRAYYFGLYFLVEIDLCLPPETHLNVAHDIGESLQISVEALDEVERCFIHLDTETDHSPEHKRL